MNLSDFHYDLPPGFIAQEPETPRDRAKLMVVPLGGGAVKHVLFRDLPDFLRAGDVLVLNKTRVFPARLRGTKKTGGKVEVLLLKAFTFTPSPALRAADMGAGEGRGEGTYWKALVRGANKPAELYFAGGLNAKMVKRCDDGEWLLEFSSANVREILDRQGEMPLPPYIKRPHSRTLLLEGGGSKGGGDSFDRERYQTVFAKDEGSVAAPTAGFHFTPELLDRLRLKGIRIVEIVLHVGWGTFRPVRVEQIEKHRMLPESYDLSKEAAGILNEARAENRRIIAVGTTVVRSLESSLDKEGHFIPQQRETNLFIYPGYDFRVINGLITNFHLPDSTPLLLANAFYSDRGPANVPFPFSLKHAYMDAIREHYRFYSYGDAMAMI
jgi:S-adenosylmethionine:tRNA ribosyltransferase-isomerase